MFSSESWVLVLILEYNGLHQWLLFERIVNTACFGRALTRFLQDQTASRCVKIVSYFASFNQEEFVSLISLSSKSSLFLAFLTFRIAAFTFPSVLLLIWSLIKEFNGGTTTMTGCIGESVWHLDRESILSKHGRWPIFCILLVVHRQYVFQSKLPPSTAGLVWVWDWYSHSCYLKRSQSEDCYKYKT